MPKLWDDTIDAHREHVRNAILDATAALATQQGLKSVTMSQIAEHASIGRATLYKYFPDIEAILHAWHARQIGEHLQQLAAVRDRTSDPGRRLETVLRTYGQIAHHTRGRHDLELVTFLHQDDNLADAQQELYRLVAELIADAAGAGHVRRDIPPEELATYCLNALNAAATLPSPAAVERLAELTLTAMRTQVSVDS